MNTQSRRTPFLLGAAAALALTFGAVTLAPAVSFAADSTQTPAALGTATQAPVAPGDARGAAREDRNREHDTYLAEALGITVEDLQAAYVDAGSAALDQAVEQDLLTATQADQLRQRLESGNPRGFGLGHFESDTMDGEALLADALGITVDELKAAQEEAEAAELAQAVAGGNLTQEQADLMLAQRALHEYIRSQQPTYAESVQAAVDAGAITQNQADLLLANQDTFGGRGGDFGPGMGGGRGGQGGGRH